jgi:hypothetical protein
MTDEVQKLIRQARAKGGFRKKGHFRLAHDKARSKIGEYALPSSRYYCLELIQAAVAAGAAYIDVRAEDGVAIVTMAGVWFDRKDMEMLFNFILTSREEPYYRARRRLAIGTAAALSLPHTAETRVVIETGDGTMEGSTRVELMDLKTDAEIGTPKKAVKGTFVRVNRKGGNEVSVIEERCLNLPVTLCLNDDIITGIVGKRGIRLAGFGYRHAVSFDEGDFYGGVTLDTNYPNKTAEMKILTNGVWITSIGLEALPEGIFGIVNFDWLRKTANQYEIVRDERLGALVERLKPYVDRILEKAGRSQERRLAFLCHRQPYDIFSAGDPCRVDVEDVPRVGGARLYAHMDDSGSEGMKLYAHWNGRLVDSITIPFERPCNVRVELDRLTLECLHFRSFGREAYDSNYVVALLPEIYDPIVKALNEHSGEILRHLETSGRKHAAATAKAQARLKAEQERAEKKNNKRQAGKDAEKRDAPPGVSEEGSQLTLKDVMDMARGKAGSAVPAEERREAPARAEESLYRYQDGVLTGPDQDRQEAAAGIRTSFEIPVPAEIAEALKNAGNYRDKLGTTAQLLGRITASALGISFSGADAAMSRRKIRFAEADRSVLVYGVVPALVYPTHLQNPAGGDTLPAPPLSMDLMPELYFNAGNPVIAGLLADLESRPECLYALAVILFHELSRMVSFRLRDRALVLCSAILHALLGVGETEPSTLSEIMKKRRKS